MNQLISELCNYSQFRLPAVHKSPLFSKQSAFNLKSVRITLKGQLQINCFSDCQYVRHQEGKQYCKYLSVILIILIKQLKTDMISNMLNNQQTSLKTLEISFPRTLISLCGEGNWCNRKMIDNLFSLSLFLLQAVMTSAMEGSFQTQESNVLTNQV